MNRSFKNVVLNHTIHSTYFGDYMEIENGKRVGIYAVSGVLIAVMIIAGVLVSGIQFPSKVNAGTLVVLITDAPVDLRDLNLTIDSLSIQHEDGCWIDLELLKKPTYFNLLELENISMTLSVTEIPAGNYTMLKMHVLTANATFLDGTVVDLRVPSEYIRVLLKPHLEMENGGVVTVTIDLEPEWSKIVISHSLNLKPTVKAIVGSTSPEG